MNPTRAPVWIAVAAALALLAGVAGASDAGKSENEVPVGVARLARDSEIGTAGESASGEQLYDTERLALLTSATTLKGRKITDLDDHAVGKIEDLVLDLGKNKVIAAYASSGTAGQVIPMPARCFVVVYRTKAVVRPGEQLVETVPQVAVGSRLDAAVWNQSLQHFHRPADEACTPSWPQLWTSSSLLGLPVIGRDRQTLGRVEDIMVDLPVGQIVYVVVEPVVGPETQATRYAIPPNALEADSAQQALVLDTDAAHFIAGPKFPADFPTEMVSSKFAAAVQRHYSQPNEAASMHTARVQPKPPSAGLASSGNREKARAVLDEIMKDLNPSQVRDISVVIVNNKFVLNGHLSREKYAQQAVAAAERVVGAGNVENHLQNGRSKAGTAPW